MGNNSNGRSQRSRFFRKKLVIPTEHGSWSWLLVPYFVGLLVAREWNLEVALVLVGAMAGFLVRQPAISWMRIRSGRGRKSDLPIAAGWTIGLSLVAVLSFLGLMLLGRAMLLWLLLPMVIIFTLYLVASRQRRASVRSLWMEVAGAAGLAASAPAAYIAATGTLDRTAWTLWGLMAGQNMLGVLYVRLRIADTHDRSMSRLPLLWGHIGVLAAFAAAASRELIPWLAVVPFAGYLVRAVWVFSEVRPVDNIIRFGFTEIGIEILGGVLIVAGYWMI
jgi:hypothetical protein